MNIAETSIVTHSARLHNRLIHSRWTIKLNFARVTGKSRDDHSCRGVFQGDQHVRVIEVLVIAADELILKIHDPLSRSLYFPDQRQTYFAVAANFLCLVQIGVFGERNLDRISGGKSYSSVRTWWIRQRRPLRLASSAGEHCNRYQREAGMNAPWFAVLATSCLRAGSYIVANACSLSRHVGLFTP